MAWLLLLSAVPAGVVGVTFESTLIALSDEIALIAVLLIVFGLVLYVADRMPEARSESEFGWRDALYMGGGQAMALLPGVSRSGVTISVARGLTFERADATRLAFLMSLPVIFGAGVVRGFDVVRDGIPQELVGGFIVGFVASAVTGWLAVWWMLRFVRTGTFGPFVVYRAVLGLSVLLLLATGLR
jgi:undecaprenyl-diphosphatase